MDLTEEMNVTKPFGPTIGEIQVIPEFVKNLNDYSDEIIKDKEKSKNLDAGDTLVGAVTQEISLEKEFFVSKISPYLSNMIAAYMYKSRPDLEIGSIDNFKKKLLINFRQAWIVRQFENEYNPLHFHTGNISGVCYTMLPKDFGKPPQNKKGVNHNGHIQLAHGANIFNCKALELIKPEVGKFILFPNYMLHTVYPFYGPGERRSFSFNADIAIKK